MPCICSKYQEIKFKSQPSFIYNSNISEVCNQRALLLNKYLVTTLRPVKSANSESNLIFDSDISYAYYAIRKD